MNHAYRLPAEWEPQSAVQLTWPHDQGDWEQNLGPARDCFTRIATVLSLHQTVLIIARDDEERKRISAELARAGADSRHCRFALAASDDSWARDHSPITVMENGRPHLLKFEFNGWGGRYRAEMDNALAWLLHEQGLFGHCPMTATGIVLEGGAIETDGHGHFLLRSSCIVDDKRNPGLDQAGMSDAFEEWLGARHIHWLDVGDLDGDDTDGHIDTLARFAPDGAILHQYCDDPQDSHFACLSAMADSLRGLRDHQGRERELIPLPLPRPIRDSSGRRMPGGYANFLVANEQVLVPTYNDPADEVAINRIARAYPDHQVRGIDCRALVRQGGSLHCVTMQYPAGVVDAEAGLPVMEVRPE
ncbi:agmatine deiminase family protein [Natronospira bacteriovora]|uniref:Agmatine deiminase family protein n=1 Tax=Natronospira bacteriovora TaxID=3069753 RepID=A0ABU0W2T4_9GAMM|nr:agmatine deiminase family protein [Natronospira sp. AB-CW4]MDQ2068267.1 agmatine deiminase family protein [Natronospira sp. AB-CW4]